MFIDSKNSAVRSQIIMQDRHTPKCSVLKLSWLSVLQDSKCSQIKQPAVCSGHKKMSLCLSHTSKLRVEACIAAHRLLAATPHAAASDTAVIPIIPIPQACATAAACSKRCSEASNSTKAIKMAIGPAPTRVTNTIVSAQDSARLRCNVHWEVVVPRLSSPVGCCFL